MSQLTVTVLPTAAVALVPRVPTMAVSIYCTAVLISCSSMVGQASEITAGSRGQANMLFFCLFSMEVIVSHQKGMAKQIFLSRSSSGGAETDGGPEIGPAAFPARHQCSIG